MQVTTAPIVVVVCQAAAIVVAGAVAAPVVFVVVAGALVAVVEHADVGVFLMQEDLDYGCFLNVVQAPFPV